jgi:hypothetical protein
LAKKAAESPCEKLFEDGFKQSRRMSSMDIIYPGVSADRNKVTSATSSPEK